MSKKQIAAITEKLDIPAPSLTPKELVSKIYETTKNEEKLGRFKGEINKPEDLKASIVILALLLQENIHPELINIILQHSIQNGYNEGGIDLNITRIISSSEDNLLDYAIQGCNYEHFRKLIELNVNYLNCIGSINSWPGKWNGEKKYTEQDRENRRKILKDLLNLGVKVTEDLFDSFTRDSEVDFFEIVAESESGKKLLTTTFLEKLTETAKYNREYKKDSSMLTTIIKFHKRKKVEEILKQEATKEGMREILLVTEGEIKKKTESIINSPEFKAQIVEYLIHYYGDDLAFQIAEGLRKKLLENPKQILDLLLPKL